MPGDQHGSFSANLSRIRRGDKRGRATSSTASDCPTRRTQITHAVSSHLRGGSRSSRTRGGMRWMLAVPITNVAEADGEVVWPWHLNVGVPAFSDCLSGKSPQVLSSPLAKNIPSSHQTQITGVFLAVSSHPKGRLAIVTDAGRDAVDA
jgi:hypothetical protein